MADINTCLSEPEIKLYLSGEISQQQASRCEEHLTSCKACRKSAEVLASQQDDFFKNLESPNLDEVVDSIPEVELTQSLNAISGLSAMRHLEPDVFTDFSSFKFIRDYRVIRQLGEGGMGRVFLAVHDKLDKKVALKILQSKLEKDDEAISRFKREMKAVGQLEHPNIVRALDAGEEQGMHYLVMEYLQGIDLDKYIAEQPNRRVCDCCEIIRQAGLALAHAHQMGLVHRDIKPSNFILTREGEVKLLDLGLAQLFQQVFLQEGLTQNGQLLGTIKYMAPEQFGETQVTDFHCDIYSLGATFCELLLGTVPSNQPGHHSDLDNLFSKRNDIPKDLLALVASMLDPDPEQRPSSCEMICAQLSNWCDGANLKAIYQRRESGNNGISDSPMPPRPPGSSFVQTINNLIGRTKTHLESWPTRIMILILILSVVILAWPTPKSETITKDEEPSQENGQLIVSNFQNLRPDVIERLRLTDKEGKQWPVTGVETDLPPGAYDLVLLESEDPESNEQLDEQSIVVTKGGNHKISLKLDSVSIEPDFNVWWPKIPAGKAMVKYRFTLEDTNRDGEESITPYEVSLFSHESGEGDPPGSSWIEVEISSTSELTEKTYLLVNRDAYRSGKPLKILDGWTMVEVPDMQQRLKSLIKKRLKSSIGSYLVSRFDLHKDHLRKLAKDWQIDWENRVNTQTLLALLFGVDSNAADSKIRLLPNLAHGSAELKLQNYTVSGNSISCIGANSQSGENQLSVIRSKNSDQIPFSLADWTVSSKNTTVRISVKDFRPRHSPELPGHDRELPEWNEIARLSNEIEELPVPMPPKFLFAFFPTPGSWVQFQGDLGIGTKINVKVIALNPDKSNPDYRWLQIRSEGGNSVDGFSEQVATLLIDEKKYSSAEDGSSKFEIIRGYFQADDFCFEFHGGDLGLILSALQLAGQGTDSGIISPHHVATLMFDADLPITSSFRAMRHEFHSGEVDPVSVIIEAQSPGKDPVRGQVYVKPYDDEVGSYTVEQSKDIPFGFADVDLKYKNKMRLKVELDDYDWDKDFEEVNEVALGKLVEDTKKRLKEKSVKIWQDRRELRAGKLVHIWDGKIYLQHVASIEAYDIETFGDLEDEDFVNEIYELYPFRTEWRFTDGTKIEGIPILFGNDIKKEDIPDKFESIKNTLIQFHEKGSLKPVIKNMRDLADKDVIDEFLKEVKNEFTRIAKEAANGKHP